MGDTFKALASEPRRRILNHLAGGPMTVGEIAEQFDMAMPSISKHLSVLKEARLVTERRVGQHVLYSLDALNLTNTVYGFISNFCPEAREITRRRARGGDSLNANGKRPKKNGGRKTGSGKKKQAGDA